MKPSIDGYQKSQASQQSTVPTPPPPPSVGGASFIALPSQKFHSGSFCSSSIVAIKALTPPEVGLKIRPWI